LASGWPGTRPGRDWARSPVSWRAASSPRRSFAVPAVLASVLPDLSLRRPPMRSPGTDVPRLDDLGRDLLTTTRRQRWLACARPFFGLAVYAVVAWLGWWWLAPFVVFLIFVAVVTVTHDVVHGSLGLTARQTEWGLFLCGAVLLESGHAYRAT